MVKKLSLILMVCLMGITGSLPALAQGGLPTLGALSGGWNTLSPGGNTGCSNGDPFAFYARPAATDRLVIFFQGGGACWYGQICDLTLGPTYDPVVDDQDHPQWYNGIFDLGNPENPLIASSMVVVPYCTGDFHLGNRVTTYPVGGSSPHDVTIHHNGYANAMSVLDWIFANFPAPQTVFVAGSSAGSVPAPFYGGLVADHYPRARIVVLGDGGGGWHMAAVPGSMATLNNAWGTLSILPGWPGYAGATADNLTFERHYIAAASRHPNALFAQYNTAYDETQYFFLGLFNINNVQLPDMLNATFAQINGAVRNFRSYTAGGSLHTILQRPEFYTYQTNGVRFADWVAALAAGQDVPNVMCVNCGAPETYPIKRVPW